MMGTWWCFSTYLWSDWKWTDEEYIHYINLKIYIYFNEEGQREFIKAWLWTNKWVLEFSNISLTVSHLTCDFEERLFVFIPFMECSWWCLHRLCFLRTITRSHNLKVLGNESTEFYVSHRTCVNVSHIKQHDCETSQLKTKQNHNQLCVAYVTYGLSRIKSYRLLFRPSPEIIHSWEREELS